MHVTTPAASIEEAVIGQEPLHRLVARLLSDAELDTRLSTQPGLDQAIMAQVEDTIKLAFGAREDAALSAVHRTLSLLYEIHIRPARAQAVTHQYQPFLLALRGRLEQAWEQNERVRAEVEDAIPTDPAAFEALFMERFTTHEGATHPLFAYLEQTAPREQLVRFFLHDTALNLRFFDLLALALVGTDGPPKQELMQNLWDETGHGIEGQTHTNLFKRVLAYVGVDLPPDHFLDLLDWPGLAGYNLFLYLALHRRHYYTNIGCMAVTELLDPPLYTRLVAGCRRVGLTDEEALAYYYAHIVTDVAHGAGWIERVMLPTVREQPEARADILLGAAMRLNTCSDYHTRLLARLQGACS